jgi:hypothetical protein
MYMINDYVYICVYYIYMVVYLDDFIRTRQQVLKLHADFQRDPKVRIHDV